jgi:hypothetical protein
MDITNQPEMRTKLHSVWTVPLPTEIGAPAERIIHTLFTQSTSPLRIVRLGLRPGAGYFKCGSRAEDGSEIEDVI